MEIKSKKNHPEFDLNFASSVYKGLEKDASCLMVTSPFAIYTVEHLRDLHGIRDGRALDSDVFIFGFGEPQKRYITKVSGLPYWPQGKAWPHGDDGEPYQFLAQFCFRDSVDLLGALPGDILLLFVPRNDNDWMVDMETVKMEWMTIGDYPLIDKLPEGVVAYSESVWYGTMHKTKDYPEAMAKSKESQVQEWWNLPVINGSKIGGFPSFIQKQPELRIDQKTGRIFVKNPEFQDKSELQYLCQLGSIQPMSRTPYPWTNQEGELPLNGKFIGSYDDKYECMFSDAGSIYVFMDKRGNCFGTSQF